MDQLLRQAMIEYAETAPMPHPRAARRALRRVDRARRMRYAAAGVTVVAALSGGAAAALTWPKDSATLRTATPVPHGSAYIPGLAEPTEQQAVDVSDLLAELRRDGHATLRGFGTQFTAAPANPGPHVSASAVLTAIAEGKYVFTARGAPQTRLVLATSRDQPVGQVDPANPLPSEGTTPPLPTFERRLAWLVVVVEDDADYSRGGTQR